MNLHTYTAAASGRTPLTICPACGERPIAPLATGFLGSGRIRHVWACDHCSHAFGTCVSLDATFGRLEDDN